MEHIHITCPHCSQPVNILMDNDKLLDLRTAAAMLDIHPATLTRWANTGKIPYKRNGKYKNSAMLFDPDHVKALTGA